MDRSVKLSQAVRNGDTDQLLDLIEENPAFLEEANYHLEKIADKCLLDVAVLANRVKSVEVIINHKPGWIEKLNKDGFRAIHMASAIGSKEIVRALLEKDSGQNQLTSGDGRRALHFAVLSESEDVLRELMTRGIPPDQLVSNLTDQNEPILHYALKRNRVQSFKHFLKLLEENINEEEIKSFLNVQDDDGNRVLHIATARRQIEVLKLLLPQSGRAGGSSNRYQVEMNATNNDGHAALDVFYNSQGHVENINKKIERMLKEAGAYRSQDTPPLQQGSLASTQDSSLLQKLWNHLNQLSCDRYMCKLWEAHVTQQIEASDPTTKEALLVVAVLIATITYQAVLSPPGGFKQPHGEGDDAKQGNQLAQQDQQHFNGMAVIASDKVMFALITSFGAVGFFSSMLIIILLTRGFPLKLLLWLAVGALCADFIASLSYIAPIGFKIACLVGIVFGFVFGSFLLSQPIIWFLFWVRKRLWNPATKTRDATALQPHGNASV